MTSTSIFHSSSLVRLFFILCIPPLFFVFPYIGVINNPNENVRTYMTIALVEHKTFRIDKVVEQYGWVNDMAKAPDRKTGEFHYYSVKAPAVSYMGVPFYWIFTKVAPHLGIVHPHKESSADIKTAWFRATTWVLRIFSVQLPCFLFLIWFERYLRAFSKDTILRLCTVAAVGLGTNYLAYSLMFTSHALFAVAAFTSFAIATRERLYSRYNSQHRRISAAFLAGFFAGFATLLEYHALPVSALLGLYACTLFWRPAHFAALSLGAAIHAGALFFFQWRSFGSPFTPGHRMSENPAFAQILNQGYFGIGSPDWNVFKQISWSRSFGFFGTSPFMIIGLFSIPLAFLLFMRSTSALRRIRSLAMLSWPLIMLTLWVTVSAAANWRGGWTIGPRYLGAAPPFFALGALYVLEFCAGQRETLRRCIVQGVACGIAFSSLLQTGLISILMNTIPESIARPLPQLAWPLLCTGFLPHHIGEWFNWNSTTLGYITVFSLLIIIPIVVCSSFTKSILFSSVRMGTCIIFLWIGLRFALSKPNVDENTESTTELRAFMQSWEPSGRDRITQLRKNAEKYGHKQPCLWHQLAYLERSVHLEAEAQHDEQRTTLPANSCPIPFAIKLKI